jgi:3-dehydroquinate dehydratase
LLTALQDSISKFQRKGVELYLRNYLETVIANAYFKVPLFRHAFLECLTKKDFAIVINEASFSHSSADG